MLLNVTVEVFALCFTVRIFEPIKKQTFSKIRVAYNNV